MEDLSKAFKIKSVYATEGKRIQKAYHDFVLNNKKIDDVLYGKTNNELIDRNNIFQESKKLFDLRVENYIKLALKKKKI